MLRFFVVDDDEFASMVVETLISSQGCPVEVCSNGAAALATLTQARCEQNPFHVMLLDWELGDMTGLEVVEKLREGYPWLQDLRIIMVSGNTPDEQTMATLGALGVDDYWEKPVSAKQLQDLLRECAAATSRAAPDATSAAGTSSAASAAAADAKPPS